MSKHTPGPWRAVCRKSPIEHDLRGLHKWSIGQPVSAGSDWFEQTVCWIIPRVFGEMAGHAANARLIAAAPDMLEVLENIADGPNRTPPEIVAVIAKAKGESE